MLRPSISLVDSFNATVSTDNATVGSALPMVFGRNVYVPSAPVLSHKITVSADRWRLVHSVISLLSIGEIEEGGGGELIEIEKAVYNRSVRIGRDRNSTDYAFDDWRTGLLSQSNYTRHGSRSISFQVNAKEIKIPARLDNNVAVVGGAAFWYDGDQWRSQTLTPNSPVTMEDWCSWVTLDLDEQSSFGGLATVLSRIESPTYGFTPPDFIVKQGKRIPRIERYDSGPVNSVDFNERSVLSLIDGQVYRSAEETPNFDLDEDWVTYSMGISDRFPDVLHYLATHKIKTVISPGSLINYESLVTANSHVDAQGLHVNGILNSGESENSIANRYAKLFDLLPITIESQLGLLVHTVESPIVEGLFTPINTTSFSYTYRQRPDNNALNVYALTVSPYTSNFTTVNKTTVIGGGQTDSSIGYDFRSFLNDQASVTTQLERIKQSALQQTEQIEIIVTNPVSLEPGDFIYASDPSVHRAREYAGGVTARSGEYFELSTPIETTTATADDTSVPNTITYITDAYLNVKVSDFIELANITQDATGRVTTNNVYLAVTDVTTTINDDDQYVTTVRFDRQVWNGEFWVNANEIVSIPKRTRTIIYPLTLASNTVTAIVNNLIVQTSFKLHLLPVGDRVTFAMSLPGLTAALKDSVPIPSPVIVQDDPVLWRIALIEPVSRAITTRDTGATFRLIADNYPFTNAVVSNLSGELPDTTASTVTDLTVIVNEYNFPDYTFTGHTDLPPRSNTSFNPALPDYPFTLTIPDAIAPSQAAATDANPQPATFNELQPLSAAEIAAKYNAAVLRLPVRETEAEGDVVYATGFLVSHDGLFVTNEHVASTVTGKAQTRAGDEYEIEWLLSDNGSDIALGRIVPTRSPAITLPLAADSSGLIIGNRVYAIGHPFENGTQQYWDTTTSVVEDQSGRCTPNGDIRCYKAADGLLESGSSGSPVFNEYGQLVGMARAIAFTDDGEKDFFVPIEAIRDEMLKRDYPIFNRRDLPSAVTVNDGYSRAEAIALFYELAFGEGLTVTPSGSADQTNVINKWQISPTDTISVSLNGLFSIGDVRFPQNDVEIINAAMTAADEAIYPDSFGSNFTFADYADTKDGTIVDADITIVGLPSSQFDTLFGERTKENVYTWVAVDAAGAIVKARAVVRATGLEYQQHAQAISLALFRCLGLFGISNRFTGSIFHPSSTVSAPSPIDIAALRVLHQAAVTPGQTQSQTTELIKYIAIV